MDELSIFEIQQKMENGDLSAYNLIKFYLDRIEKFDRHGPNLNSIIELNPDSLEEAKRLDEERRKKGPRSLLHGIPILIKDNIETSDKMMTTAGSLSLMNNYSKEDAIIVKQLRLAGAIMLGKTNLSEWANFRSSHSTSGWSSRGGQTYNPYFLNRSPSGSSSGSAVAVAANFCTVAIGTETDGSIISPSHINGIVGLKPTHGLLSQSGIIPLAHSQDTAGPMGRNVYDIAILLNFLVSSESSNNDKSETSISIPHDYTVFLNENGLENVSLGIARHFFGFNPKVDAIMKNSIKTIENLGAKIIDPIDLEPSEDLEKKEYEILLYEFKNDLNLYLMGKDTNIPVHSLKEIIEFNENHRDSVMPYFEQDEMIKSEEKGSTIEDEYLSTLKSIKEETKNLINQTLEKNKIQAIIAPSGAPAWLIDWLNGDHYTGGGTTNLPAISGYPHITVPAGYIHGLPVGISFFSGAYQEPLLLKIAYSFEQATKVRKPPEFKKAVQF